MPCTSAASFLRGLLLSRLSITYTIVTSSDDPSVFFVSVVVHQIDDEPLRLSGFDLALYRLDYSRIISFSSESQEALSLESLMLAGLGSFDSSSISD